MSKVNIQVDEEIAERLRDEAARTGESIDIILTRTLRILRQEADEEGAAEGEADRENTLSAWLTRYAGSWTKEEFEEFERNTAAFEEIDEEMWE